MATAASNVLIYIAMVAAFNSETSSSVFDGSIDLACPGALVKVDGPFIIRSSSALWVACEDLSMASGPLVLISNRGDAEWFAKGYAPYVPHPDPYYYNDLNVTFTTTGPDEKHKLPPKTLYGKAAINAAGGLGNYQSAGLDVLGIALLNQSEVTWSKVERAVPPFTMGNFVGSRESSVDTTFGEHTIQSPPTTIANILSLSLNEL